MRKYFGTDGIRNIANTKLSPELVYRIAKAGAYVLAKHSDHAPTILIGRDTRISGNLIESAMMAGFLSYGANVKLLGVIPTPGVAYLTRKLNADAGVVISASHNSYEFNGIKFFSNKGTKIPDEIEEEIEEMMDSEELDDLRAINDQIGVYENREDLVKEYIKFVISNFKDEFEGVAKKGYKIAIDTANGATYKVAKEIFEELGITPHIMCNEPNGININANCGSTHLENLRNYVLENHMDLGIAYDGDGDRCLAIDEKGNELNGDKLLAILANDLKKAGKLEKNTVVATVMSNLGLNRFLADREMDIVQTKVGDRYVLEEMLKQGYNLGGEQSGHVILLEYNPTGDGILTSLLLILAAYRADEKVSGLNEMVKVYPQVLVNAKVSAEKKHDYEKDTDIKEAISKLEKEFAGNGRVLIRPSGTEPLVRVMIEGENTKLIEQKAKEIASLMEEKLN